MLSHIVQERPSPSPDQTDEQTDLILADANQDLADHKKGKWTPEEDILLRECVKKFGDRQWKLISNEMPGRSLIQCLHRWTKVLRPGLIKGPWTQEEDEKLIKWINKHGPSNWTEAANAVPGRSGKQCRERWLNKLNPEVKTGSWSLQEDELIFRLYQEHGSSWSLIAKMIPGRTENAIKNRFYSSVRRLATVIKRNNEAAKNQELQERFHFDLSSLVNDGTSEKLFFVSKQDYLNFRALDQEFEEPTCSDMVIIAEERCKKDGGNREPSPLKIPPNSEKIKSLGKKEQSQDSQTTSTLNNKSKICQKITHQNSFEKKNCDEFNPKSRSGTQNLMGLKEAKLEAVDAPSTHHSEFSSPFKSLSQTNDEILYQGQYGEHFRYINAQMQPLLSPLTRKPSNQEFFPCEIKAENIPIKSEDCDVYKISKREGELKAFFNEANSSYKQIQHARCLLGFVSQFPQKITEECLSPHVDGVQRVFNLTNLLTIFNGYRIDKFFVNSSLNFSEENDFIFFQNTVRDIIINMRAAIRSTSEKHQSYMQYLSKIIKEMSEGPQLHVKPKMEFLFSQLSSLEQMLAKVNDQIVNLEGFYQAKLYPCTLQKNHSFQNRPFESKISPQRSISIRIGPTGTDLEQITKKRIL